MMASVETTSRSTFNAVVFVSDTTAKLVGGEL
jgi:hypothetical protein